MKNSFLNSVLRKTLWDYRWQIFLWALGLVAMLPIFVASFQELRAAPDRQFQIENYRKLALGGTYPGGKEIDLETFGGYLGMTLSTPEPRWSVLLARFLVYVISSGFMIAFTWGITVLAAWNFQIKVDNGKLAVNFLGQWIMCLAIASLGFALAGFKPKRTVAILGTYVVASFLLELIGLGFKVPGWILNLSVFHLHGKPILTGLDLPAHLFMLGLSLGLLGVATWGFERRDLVG